MISLITPQRTLVEAANAYPYGWLAAKLIEPGHPIFNEQDKDNTKSLREAESAFRRDSREFKARRGRSSKGRGHGGRFTGFDLLPRISPYQINQTLKAWTARYMGASAQGVTNNLNKSGQLLECFKFGDSSYLIANCAKNK